MTMNTLDPLKLGDESPADLTVRLTILEHKLDQLLQTMRTIKLIIVWVAVISALLMILPLFGLLFALPSFLSSFSGYGDLLK